MLQMLRLQVLALPRVRRHSVGLPAQRLHQLLVDVGVHVHIKAGTTIVYLLLVSRRHRPVRRITTGHISLDDFVGLLGFSIGHLKCKSASLEILGLGLPG